MSRRFVGPLVLAAAVAIAGVVKLGAQVVTDWPDSAQLLDPPSSVIDRYDKECPADKAPTPECAGLRGAVVYILVDALQTMAEDDDRSAGDVALLALEAPEPEVQLAALDVLGRAPDRPGSAAKTAALLLGQDRIAIQIKAARALAGTTEVPALRRIGEQWLATHSDPEGCCRASGLAPIDWKATHPEAAKLGFKPYPGARPFSPVTSNLTAGFQTPDPVEQVVAFYAKGAAVPPMDVAGWQQWIAAHQEAYFGKPPDFANDPDMKETQRLFDEYQKTQDPKLIEKMQAASERFQKKLPSAADQDPGVLDMRTQPPVGDDLPGRTARIIVVETRDNRAARLVVVYRDDAVNQTIVQMAWDRRYVPEFTAGQAP